MRILWITNTILPGAARALGMKALPVGGWMDASMRRLLASPDIALAVAATYDGKRLLTVENEGVRYYLLPRRRPAALYDPSLEALWRSVRDDFNPEVVHIHGTEFPHSLAWVRGCGPQGVCVSIQGLVSVYARYYFGGMLPAEVRRAVTPRDIARRDTLPAQQRAFRRRGIYERELLASVAHVMGRTDWDRSHTLHINPDASYHFVGETLRGEFRGSPPWSYAGCEPHTIFLSQGSYPIKGAHKVIEALPAVMRRYPDVRVDIAGWDILNLPIWRLGGYGLYLRRLIARLGVAGRVRFLGLLDAGAMVKAYRSANLFISPSSIENSPNSVGEAQTLRMPYLASYVGGTPEIVGAETFRLYRFEETEQLASKICAEFAKGADAASGADLTRYDPDLNLRALLDAYRATAP